MSPDQLRTVLSDLVWPMLNAVPGGTTVTSDALSMSDGVKFGSIVIATDASYNGTTGTAVLQGSNDGASWPGVLQDDNTTAMSFTLATASTYTWQLKTVLFRFYRIVYTHGDASAGTVTANFVGKK